MYRTLLFNLLLIPFLAFSQDLPYAKTIIAKLASPEFKGRGYVDNADRLAADYIAQEFQKMGLQRMAWDRSVEVTKISDYYQNFNVSVNTLPGMLMVKLNNVLLTPGVDYLADAGSPSLTGNFPVTVATRKDISNGDFALKLLETSTRCFILIDNRNKAGESKEQSAATDEFIEMLKQCANKNIKGIIIYTSDKLTWEPSATENPRPVLIVSKELDLPNTKRLEIIIENYFFKKYETQNICAVIPGTSKSDSLVVVTAHFDHLGMMGQETYFPGANDNASGVAMLLNLAKHYSVTKPKNTIVFIALAAEELGILGAREFAEHPLFDLKKVKFMINIDLAGTGDEGIKVVNGSVFKGKFELLSKLNKEGKLLPKVDIRGEACISDHCPFYMKGVPCFYIYTLGGIKAYHDIYDKSETLPLTEFEDYCKLLVRFFDAI